MNNITYHHNPSWSWANRKASLVSGEIWGNRVCPIMNVFCNLVSLTVSWSSWARCLNSWAARAWLAGSNLPLNAVVAVCNLFLSVAGIRFHSCKALPLRCPRQLQELVRLGPLVPACSPLQRWKPLLFVSARVHNKYMWYSILGASYIWNHVDMRTLDVVRWMASNGCCKHY